MDTCDPKLDCPISDDHQHYYYELNWDKKFNMCWPFRLIVYRMLLKHIDSNGGLFNLEEKGIGLVLKLKNMKISN